MKMSKMNNLIVYLVIANLICMSCLVESRRRRRFKCYRFICQKCHVFIHSRYRRSTFDEVIQANSLLEDQSEILGNAGKNDGWSEKDMKNYAEWIDGMHPQSPVTWFEKGPAGVLSSESDDNGEAEDSYAIQSDLADDWEDEIEQSESGSHVHKRSIRTQRRLCLQWLKTRCCRRYTKDVFIGYQVRA